MPIREPNYSVKWMAVNAASELQKDLIDALGGDLKGNMQTEAPIGQGPTRGALRKSIIYQDGRVVATAPHALYVHEGTRPHVILPRRKPFLAWQSGGAWHYARRVNHPGTRPNPFGKRALETTKLHWPGIAQKVGERWLRKNALR